MKSRLGFFDEKAACLSADPDIFFPDGGGSAVPAKRICCKCPVMMRCLEYALENDEKFGVWGGLSKEERKKIEEMGLHENVSQLLEETG